MYGLCIVMGLFAAGFFLYVDCKRKNLLWENALIADVIAVGIGFWGAKILYLAVSFTPRDLLAIIQQGEVQAVIQGGFVFYGGLIFGILGAFLGIKIAKCSMRDYENTLIQTIPLAHGFGRIGCLCAGCCYGKPTDHFFHVVFTHPASDAPVGIGLIPVQIYESLFNFILFFVLLFLDVKYPKNRLLVPIYLMAYSAERFVIEYFRYDEVRGFFGGLSTSQWISIVFFAAGAAVLSIRAIRKTEGNI